MTADAPIGRMIAALERAGCDPRPVGPGKYEARCPAHQGERRNLSVTVGDGGRVLAHCHHIDESGSGCSFESIVAALGLTPKDLHASASPRRQDVRGKRLKPPAQGAPVRKPATYDTPRAAAESLARRIGAPISGRWAYRDGAGKLYAAVYRFDAPDGKSYRPVSKDSESGRWIVKDPVRWLPYRAEELAGAGRVFLVEGEKCADLARGLGLAAMTTAHGAQSPRKTDLSALAGKEVVILPDAGAPGEGYARVLVELLSGLDPRPTTKLVRLPGLADGEDLEQWLAARPGASPEDLRAELERLADEAAPEPAGTKPEAKTPVEVDHERQRVLLETRAVLPRIPKLFRRGDVLVELGEYGLETVTLPGGVDLRRAAGAVRVAPIGEAALSCLLTAHIDFHAPSRSKDGEDRRKPVHPPAWLAPALIGKGVYPGVPPLRGVAEAPFPRPDGTIVDRPGYDETTGFYFSPTVAVPPVLDRPTQADARKAAETLLGPVDQFPFGGDDDRAVFLAAVLTVVARPAVDGPVPGFAFKGNRAGTGKGKLIDSIAMIASGRAVPTTSYPRDDAEAGKLKVAIALAATQVVHLDNLPEGQLYGSGVLDSTLTTTEVNDRILGQSRTTGPIELRCVWFLSGNQISPCKDAYRRWLVLNLETMLERPEERDDIRIPDLLSYVRGCRPELVQAALTVLRAHAVAGRPTNGKAPLGSFEEWDRVVRQAVWFATGWDCNATRSRASQDSPERLDRLALLEAWAALPDGGADGRGITAEHACRLATGDPDTPGSDSEAARDLADALARFGRDGRPPTVRSVGNTLRAIADRNFNGKVFQVHSYRKNSALWRVVSVEPSGGTVADPEGESGESGESDSIPFASELENHEVIRGEKYRRVGDQTHRTHQTHPEPQGGCGGCLRLECIDCNPPEPG